MKEYAIRRAAEVKQYRKVSEATGVNYHWLQKFAIGRIPNPNFDDVKLLHDYYHSLEKDARVPREAASELERSIAQ